MIKDQLSEEGLLALVLTYELALTSVFGHFGFVCAHKKFPFEQLNTNDTEHEDQEQGHQDDVTDGLDGHDDTLNDMFEAFGSVDGTERTQYTKDTKDLHHGYGTRAEIMKVAR